ncbi:hypothetical protein GE061_019453 [Apolygus lucorum]|uniref:Low molecular weight phosphotyrosine protein phosphatase n=1 Tax=Apolygus lucorum TaxID=248454 RepID=A0A8S9X9U4_APOLU|nr:hypothetical protein GE061_019453 [Apolygus lucorum]
MDVIRVSCLLVVLHVYSLLGSKIVMTKSVLFICLGNICRSPMAEAVFAHLVHQKGLEGQWSWDSAALGSWHVGKGPERRTMKVLKDKKVEYSHRARQINSDDFSKFDYIFGMDDDNISELTRRAPKGSSAKILLLGSFDPEGDVQIRDPYYDDDDKGFYKCYDQCLRSCTAFIESVK